MIPLSVPNLAGNEWDYVKQCLDTGWISSAGSFVSRFENAVASFAGASHGIAAVNGTAALHIALQILGVGPGDGVLIPNLTFVATANAVRYAGAEPILVDIDPHTWQMDADLLERILAEASRDGSGSELRWRGVRIGAIMPVHVLGNVMELQRVIDLADRYGIPVVEDASESLGSLYRGKQTGTFGQLGVFSFNGNKIISTGGGGVIVTDDTDLAKRAKHLTTTAKTTPDEYFHDEVGYNYRLVNVLAAIGVAQMEQLPAFLDRKRVIDARYRAELDGVGDIDFQRIGNDVRPNCWLTTIATERRAELGSFLRENGIETRPVWVPMNRLPMFSGNAYVEESDEAGSVYRRCLSIPSSTNLSDQQVDAVIAGIKAYFAR